MVMKCNLQVVELIKWYFSEVLQSEGGYVYGIEFLVMVMKVMVSLDFSQAKIYLSVYNIEDKQFVILKMEYEIICFKQVLVYCIRKYMCCVLDVVFYLDDILDEMYCFNQFFNWFYEEGYMGDEEEQQEG